MSDLIWFVRTSWGYLGCDRGTGRWRARRRLLLSGWPAWRQFHRACVADRNAAR